MGAPSFTGDTAASPSLPDLISRKNLPLRHPWVYKLLTPPTSSSLLHVCFILCSSYFVCSNLEVSTLYALLCISYTVCLRCMLELACLIFAFFPLYILFWISYHVLLTLYFLLCILLRYTCSITILISSSLVPIHDVQIYVQVLSTGMRQLHASLLLRIMLLFGVHRTDTYSDT